MNHTPCFFGYPLACRLTSLEVKTLLLMQNRVLVEQVKLWCQCIILHSQIYCDIHLRLSNCWYYVLCRAWRQGGKFIHWNSWRDSFLWYYRPSSWLVFPLDKSVVWAVIILPDGALSDFLASTWNIKSNVNLGEPFCAWIPGGYLPLYEFTIPFVHLWPISILWIAPFFPSLPFHLGSKLGFNIFNCYDWYSRMFWVASLLVLVVISFWWFPVPEIEQGLAEAANSKVTVSFTPHLMPMVVLCSYI